jgi:hypothetical protein
MNPTSERIYAFLGVFCGFLGIAGRVYGEFVYMLWFIVRNLLLAVGPLVDMSLPFEGGN